MISLDGLLLGKEGFSIDLLIMSITDGDNSELLRFHTSASSVRSQAKSKAGTRECETQDLLRLSFRYSTHTVMHFVVQYRALTHLFNLFSFFVNVGRKSGTHMYFLIMLWKSYRGVRWKSVSVWEFQCYCPKQSVGL